MGMHSGSDMLLRDKKNKEARMENKERLSRVAHAASVRWGSASSEQRKASPLQTIPLADTLFGAEAKGIALNKPSPKYNLQHFLCLSVKDNAMHNPCLVVVVFDPCDIRHAQSCMEVSATVIHSYKQREVKALINSLNNIAADKPIRRKQHITPKKRIRR